MHEIDVQNWQEFEATIGELRRQYVAPRTLLFRGLGDSTWSLTTTLERHSNVEMPFSDYYRIIAVAQPQIETFTKQTWDIATWPEIDRLEGLEGNLRVEQPRHPREGEAALKSVVVVHTPKTG